MYVLIMCINLRHLGPLSVQFSQSVHQVHVYSVLHVIDYQWNSFTFDELLDVVN